MWHYLVRYFVINSGTQSQWALLQITKSYKQRKNSTNGGGVSIFVFLLCKMIKRQHCWHHILNKIYCGGFFSFGISPNIFITLGINRGFSGTISPSLHWEAFLLFQFISVLTRSYLWKDLHTYLTLGRFFNHSSFSKTLPGTHTGVPLQIGTNAHTQLCMCCTTTMD